MRRSKHSDDSRLFFDWLEIAARDLLAARLLMERQQCLEIAGFHCQQAVEKGLKAYIIHASGQLVDGTTSRGSAARPSGTIRISATGWKTAPR